MAPSSEPRESTVSSRGFALHYVEWGAPTAPPVILLHGITGHARTWDTLAEALAPQWRVLALDQRGHGDSEPAPDGDYTPGAMADDLEAFVDALGYRRFTLLGLSMGGRVAMGFAGAHPDRVERLVIVDIAPEIHPPGMARIRTMIANAPETIESEEWAVETAMAANPRADVGELRHRIKHALKRAPDGTLTWKYARDVREMMRRGTRRDPLELWERLTHITCPTLLVRGAESDVLSPALAQRVVAALPDGRLVEVAAAGHTVPGDRPAEFVDVVRRFLASPAR
ncbi:MAG TPA: alpha/beta fold hydrolase [Methylomirabilota bacterium]|nr:alpha/beta fold hydrolase [Methylomirabilota bacterium]